MIFVTVGTHEQPFDRLIECVDHLKREGVIREEVTVQTGYSTYEPRFCAWQKHYPYQDMIRLVDRARIVVTHGGPSSFIMPLQAGKIPIVVPRQQAFHEHVNDHQVLFARAVAQRRGAIIVVEDMDRLGDTIADYDRIVRGMGNGLRSNQESFNRELGGIVDAMFRGNENKLKSKRDGIG